MTSSNMDKAVIIGFGKLGSHLYYALKRSGELKAVIAAKRAAALPEINSSGIIFITVRDSNIKDIVRTLEKKSYGLEGKFIFHTSGSLTSGELSRLSAKGAYTASFHPVQTFDSPARKDEGRFENIYVAIEGDPAAVRKGKQLARLLKAKSFIISGEDKIYHHICCVIASNYVASLLGQLEEIGSKMKLQKQGKPKQIRKNGFNNPSFFNIYKPLALQTLENVSKKGAAGSLTGPVERNDLETVIKHLDKLDKDTLRVYALMGIETVKLSLKKKSITEKHAKSFLKLFNKHVKTK